MKILVACEYSGRLRDALLAKGHDAVSCDILPTASPGPHIQGDVFPLLLQPWDMVVAFPPCTDLAASGARWWPEKVADGRQEAARKFFMACYNANAPKVAVENPAGAMTRLFRAPDQYVEPFWFGDATRKRTGLWLRGLPELVPTDIVEPTSYWVGGDAKKKGLHRNVMMRNLSHPGIVQAMADQWA